MTSEFKGPGQWLTQATKARKEHAKRVGGFEQDEPPKPKKSAPEVTEPHDEHENG